MRADRLSLICDAFQRYVEAHRDSSGQLHCEATIEVGGERRDMPWLLGQLWTCGTPMPPALCVCLGFPLGSSYAKAVQYLSRQLRQHSAAAVTAGEAVNGISTQERQQLLAHLESILRTTRDHL